MDGSHAYNVFHLKMICFEKKKIVLDRIIMIGNHRDGWVYGALDPSSGTAVLMEVARLIGQMLKDGKKFHSYYKT